MEYLKYILHTAYKYFNVIEEASTKTNFHSYIYSTFLCHDESPPINYKNIMSEKYCLI